MGKILTIHERLELLDWSETFRCDGPIEVFLPVAKCFKQASEPALRNYWGLARTARNPSVHQDIRNRAHGALFSIRTKIEKWLSETAVAALKSGDLKPADLLDGTVFGYSLKQGVSFRLPLSSCQPTGSCAGGCYAHDGLDASIATVIRGSLNGAFALHFEQSGPTERNELMDVFLKPLKTAVRHAINDRNAAGFQRNARIRMSHVGELTAYPAFANAMAAKIRELSEGLVSCVVYTRHRNAGLLDPELFVINFTLDETSLNRRSWAPPSSRIVYSAWNGVIRRDVAVNFLEHHHLAHTEASGQGKICPATKPETKEKTCDGVKCNFCFVRPT